MINGDFSYIFGVLIGFYCGWIMKTAVKQYKGKGRGRNK